MPIEVSESGSAVEVTYRDGSDNSATATVVGESLSSVESRAEEIVESHSLKMIAQSDPE